MIRFAGVRQTWATPFQHHFPVAEDLLGRRSGESQGEV